MVRHVWLSLVFMFVIACSPAQDTGPGEIRWDREVCARCNMAIGDRHFAVEVRGAPTGEQTRLYKFDDFGCAMVWLQDQDWQNDSRTEIWVADVRNGQWLDARRAVYVKDKLSPMNYGLGAISRADSEAFTDTLDFPQAKAFILEGENARYQHAGHGPQVQN